VPHDDANIMVIDQGIARVARSRGYKEPGQEEWLKSLHLSIEETPTLQQMLETGETVLIADTAGHPLWVDLKKDSLVRSYIATPIRRKGEIVGFINVNSHTILLIIDCQATAGFSTSYRG
jgi:GAF domain-containing protein